MKKITAGEVMTRDVLTVPSDLPVNRVIDMLVDHSISGAPVVSNEGKPIGVVSLSDVAKSGALVEKTRGAVPAYFRHGAEDGVARDEIRAFRVEAESQATARDIMTPVVFSVEDAASVQDVADAMIRGRIHRVLVTSGGRMVGIISSMDLLPIVRDM